MKVFHIKHNTCYNDVTARFPTVADTIGRFPPTVLFVEAPDYVREGWGYDESKEGDERFLQPQPPEGWLYDLESGTFYQEGDAPSEPEPTTEEQITDLQAMAIDYEYRLTLLELGV